jgi:predicted outer membrane repeat protein
MEAPQTTTSSSERKGDRLAWTCAALVGGTICVLVIAAGSFLLSLAPGLWPFIRSQISRTLRSGGIVLYVRSDAAGMSCSSWNEACPLQTALAAARSGDEIWVKTGVYKPAPDTSSLEATFRLIDGVAVYGGFAGTETARDQRDWKSYVTVLSGDLGGDDVTDPYGVVTDPDDIVGRNAYHVVTGSGVGSTTILDGFTITGGYANLVPPNNHAYGGGMFNWTGSPTLQNLIFTGNTAGKGAPGRGGGGMFNIYASNPMLTNVMFIANSAGSGGGMYNHASHPTLTAVTFIRNRAEDSAGMQNYQGSNPTLNDVTFSSNVASRNNGGMGNHTNANPVLNKVVFQGNSAGDYAGGLGNYESSPILTDVEFSGNRSGREGGGISNAKSSRPVLVNVTFLGNSTGINGGGMVNSESTPSLTNVTFSGNSAGAYGGGICNTFSSRPTLTNVTFTLNWAPHGSGICNVGGSFTLVNGIVWGNRPAGDPVYNDNVIPDITYSDIEGGFRGVGNLNVDPRFGLFGYHGAPTRVLPLLAGSPVIDRGSPTQCPGSDQLSLPRPADGDGDGSAICDMGAFEYQEPE